MRVALLTFHNAHNYGAVLQAYALKRVVQELGHSCDIINFKNQFIEDAYLPKRDNAKNWFKNFIIALHHVLWLDKIKRNRYYNFQNFIQKYLQSTKEEYMDCVELKRKLPEYDAYICGSDQIWNISSREFNEAYFLTFAPKEKKKIAYAPSFGVSTFTDQQREKIANYISHIDFLSIREKSGQEMIENLTNRHAELLLDPTLLLDATQWNEIAEKPKFKKPYILYYHVINRPYVWQYTRQLQRVTGYDIVSINYSFKEPLAKGVKIAYGISPEEFIGQFRDAQIICTTSFHGCVFSIINRKPFFVGLPEDREQAKDRSSRIISLLDMLGLKERIINTDSVINKNLLFLNYKETEERLKTKQEHSTNWLKTTLEA